MNKTLALIALLGSLFLNVGCTQNVSNESIDTQVSNSPGKETFVVWKKVQHPTADQDNVNKEVFEATVPKSDSEKISLLFEQLKKQQKDSDLLPTVSASIQLLNGSIENHELTLNFNDQVTKMDPSAEGVFVKSINYSMMHNFTNDVEKEIKKITYQINGKTVKTLSENEVSCNRGETCWKPFLANLTN